jgi:hypothetical protein
MSAENVVINFVGDTSALQPVENALDGIIAQSGEVGTAWTKASAAMTNQTKESVTSTNKLSKSIEQMIVATKSMDKVAIGGAYKETLKEIKNELGLTNKEIVKFLNDAKKLVEIQVGDPNTLEDIDQMKLGIEVINQQLLELGNFEGGTLLEFIKSLKNQLLGLKAAGKENTSEFTNLREEIVRLQNEYNNTNKELKNLGSDTKGIDGVISLAGGVASGFAVAQGAAALFGDENEEVQKALLKVNAAMSFLQGLQGIQNVLQKESAASLLFASGARTTQTAAVVAETVAEGANVVATEAATVAQVELNTAMSLNPVGLLIVGILAAVAAFSAFGDEVESSVDRIERLQKKAEDVYTALQNLSKVNQFAVDREVEITKNKELVNVLEAQNTSIQNINQQKKIGIGLENDKLKDELSNIESVKDISEDKNQFVERELAIKSQIYSNDQAQLVLDIETNKVLAERALKSNSANADAEVAKRKLAIIQNQIDSIASIKAISDAEIEAIKRKKQEDLNPANQLTAGEIAKVNADANLAIAENRKALSQKLLEIDTAGIEAKVLLAKKGSEDEYQARLLFLQNEQQTLLAATKVTKNDKLKIEADFYVKKKALDQEFAVKKLENEISYFDANIAEFGLSENRKLELTIRRLDKQRDLEILQAEDNAAKIAEINAKYDLQNIEANKASIANVLADNLKTVDAFSGISNAANEKILTQDKSTFDQRVAASKQLLSNKLLSLDLEASAEKKKLAVGLEAAGDDINKRLFAQHEYDVAVQLINNQRSAAAIKSEEETTAATLKEIEKRTVSLQNVFSIVQKGLQATLGNSPLTTALTDLQNFGVQAQDVFAKIKAGTITSAEGFKQLAGSAIASMQEITNQLFADNSAQRAATLQDTLSILDEQKNKELSNKNLTEQQKAEIDKKYKDKERQEKIKAFEAEKGAKKEQAIINGLLAVTNVWAQNAGNPILAAILTALTVTTTAIQVAKISAAKTPKFFKGKVGIEGPGTTTSDSIPAMISRGESVINAKATNKWKQALEAINNNQFESYLASHFTKLAMPQIPEGLIAGQNGLQIDYEKLALAIAGKIPEPTYIQNNIDESGFQRLVIKNGNKTEYKNQRYSMT